MVDAAHYKVEFENDQVRVLRVIYGPLEKSVMHEHPASIGVYLTDDRPHFCAGRIIGRSSCRFCRRYSTAPRRFS